MERKKALTLPFTVDSDALVCMTCFLKYPVCMTCLLCASSEQFASLLLILARYCSDACFITVIIKCSHDLLIRNLMRYCLMAFSVPLLSHKRGHLFATAAKGQNIIFFLKKTHNNNSKKINNIFKTR